MRTLTIKSANGYRRQEIVYYEGIGTDIVRDLHGIRYERDRLLGDYVEIVERMDSPFAALLAGIFMRLR